MAALVWLLGRLVVEHTHVLEDLAVAITDTVLAIKALLKDLLLRVKLVDYGVRVALFVVSE